ncbi:hypothetical protein [Mogibacterium diversum]|nr:hypothetical protein [Mogibacterium diversum]
MESLELKDKVNILGTEYSIKGQIGKETPKLQNYKKHLKRQGAYNIR